MVLFRLRSKSLESATKSVSRAAGVDFDSAEFETEPECLSLCYTVVTLALSSWLRSWEKPERFGFEGDPEQGDPKPNT